MRPGVWALLLGTMFSLPRAGRAAEPPASFALIVGVNRSVDADAAPLRYADDDAARFRDLFRTVGARTYLLARLDDNTRRLHPAAAEEATPPELQALEAAVARVAADVASARARGQSTVLYFVYAGHGKAEGQSGYITLEDARLTGAELLARVIDPIGANAAHIVADACHSYFLVLDRGAGGSRRPLHGFAQLGAIAQRQDIGLLLSTSSARESHEWAAFQAGVFSHEVRSGLYGPADADGDGVISYVEIAAFIERANASIPNERFRPEVFARPPGGGSALLDLRPGLATRIEVNSPPYGHNLLEDTAGVRLADFHNTGITRLVRPAAGRLYLRRAADDREYVLPPSQGVVRTGDLRLQEAHVASRGAANDAFNALFGLPFGAAAVADYRARLEAQSTSPASEPAERARWSPRAKVGAGLALLGAVSAGGGVAVLLGARSLRDSVPADASQETVGETNASVSSRNRAGLVLLGFGGAMAVGGGLLLLWPDSPLRLSASADGVSGGLQGSF